MALKTLLSLASRSLVDWDCRHNSKKRQPVKRSATLDLNVRIDSPCFPFPSSHESILTCKTDAKLRAEAAPISYTSRLFSPVSVLISKTQFRIGSHSNLNITPARCVVRSIVAKGILATDVTQDAL